MAAYDLVYVDNKTGEIQGELPAINVTHGDELNQPGGMSITLRLFDDADIPTSSPFNTGQRLKLDEFSPWKSRVYLLRDDVPLAGAIVTGQQVDLATETVTVSAIGLLGYLSKVVLTSDLTFSSTDQDAVARSLVDTFGANMDISTSANLHGVTRDRVYTQGQFKNVWEALYQLANVNNGFDFYLSHAKSGSSMSSQFHTSYPATGRATSHVFDMGSMESMSVQVDGSNLANLAVAIGGTVGDMTVFGQVSNFGHTATYPPLHDVEYYGDISDGNNLISKASRTVVRGEDVMYRVTFSKHPSIEPVVGSYLVGDLVQVTAEAGALSIDETMRITATGISIDENGKQLSTITAVSQGVFS